MGEVKFIEDVASFKTGLLPYQLSADEAAAFIEYEKSVRFEPHLKEFFQKQKSEILRLSGYKEYNPLDDMSASENAYNLIKQFEKFFPTPYDNDGGGNCTIGYGHLIRESLCTSADYAKYPNGISLSEAEAMLKSGVETAEGLIRKNVKVMLTQNQFDGLVSFIFNTGTFYPNLLNKLNTRDFDNVPAEMNNVLLSKGKIAPGLVPRRAAETELFSRK